MKLRLKMSERTFEFQEGDICSFGGVKGTISYFPYNYEYPICLNYENDSHYDVFTRDGKARTFHSEPSLLFLERPTKKKKVTKTVEVWINIYTENTEYDWAYVYKTKKAADESAVDNRIECIKLTGSYEIKVEE